MLLNQYEKPTSKHYKILFLFNGGRFIHDYFILGKYRPQSSGNSVLYVSGGLRDRHV